MDSVDIGVLLQRQQREIESGMQCDRRKQDQNAAGDARPVAVMPVRPECGAGAPDREIGAGDNAERAMERHRQDAAQRRQRPPHLGMLHEISEVFIGGKAETRRGAIDHGVHRIREATAPRRDRDDDKNFHRFLRQGDTEYRMQCLGDPGILGGREDRQERRPREAQQ